MTAYLTPMTRWFYQGAPAANGTLTVYQSGTTTPVTIYTDAALTTPATNPIALDANGECRFYVGSSVNLRIDAKTSGGTLIQSLDPVYPMALLSGSNTFTGANTFSGATTFSGDVTMSGANLKFAKDTLASAGTVALTSANGNFIHMTGSSTISSFGSSAAGETYIVKFNASPPLTYNATSMILPGGASITPDVGDVMFVTADDSSSNWRVSSYLKASGCPVNMSPITSSLGADVALNNTSNYFDGPSVAQGASGTWFVSGTVTLVDTAGVASFIVKLHDGSSTIASTIVVSVGASSQVTASLSGYIASPAGNLRISAKDASSTSGKIVFNGSGLSKDSTITAIRIA